MIEVLWHGRGGQGAFTAARLLGAAASLDEGAYALAFPSFGPERRGAPMRAFTKISDKPLGNRSAVAVADYVVYLDDTLLSDSFASELKPGGKVLVNSKNTFSDERIIALDADGISSDLLGRAIPNTVFLGAIAALCDQVTAEDVKEAVRQYMPEKLHAKNMAIVDAAILHMEAQGVRIDSSEQGIVADAQAARASRGVGSSPSFERTEGAKGLGETFENTAFGAAPPRPGLRIPSLRSSELDPQDFAHATCFEAGYLVTKNAGWRNMRPVIDVAVCTGCLQCYMLCPDGTIYKVPAASLTAGLPARQTLQPAQQPAGRRNQPETVVAFDYDFCKGCAICEHACSVGAIVMIPEKEALA